MKKKRKKKTATLNSHPSLGSAPDVLKRENLDAASFAVQLLGSDEKELKNCQVKTYEIEVAKNTVVKWETVILDHQMFIRVPKYLAPEGSKESFISLLEIAEEDLGCDQVICCLDKTGNDRSSVIRTFMFMGFEPIPPSSPVLPPGSQDSSHFLFLGCEL